ncbi:hypothetical protein NQZ68_042430, partial [Dissostichus eleginoides]
SSQLGLKKNGALIQETGPPAPAVTKHCLTGRTGDVSPQYRQGYVTLGEPGSIDISCDGGTA